MGLNLGNSLKELRKQKGISQQRLAELLECTQTHLSLVESGKKNFSSAMLDKLEEVTGIPAIVLMWRNLTVESISEEKQELFVQLKPALDTLIDTIFDEGYDLTEED